MIYLCFVSPHPHPPLFFTHWTKTLLTCIWADTVFQTQEGGKDANWLLFPMVTSFKTCTQHATPQTSTPSPSFPQTVPRSLHHPSLHVQAADLSRWEKRGSLVAANVCKAKVSHCSLTDFTSPARQSWTRSYICQSGVGALRVAWVRKRWSLLRDKRRNSYNIVVRGRGRCWGGERQREKDKGEEEKSWRARGWSHNAKRRGQEFTTLDKRSERREEMWSE